MQIQIHTKEGWKRWDGGGSAKIFLLSIAKMKREWPKANWSVTDSIKTRDHDNEFWLAVIREGAGFDHGKFWRCVTGFAHLLNWEKLHNRHLTPARTGSTQVNLYSLPSALAYNIHLVFWLIHLEQKYLTNLNEWCSNLNRQLLVWFMEQLT